MLEANTYKGFLKYGKDEVDIFLQKTTINEDDLTCYSGNIFMNGLESKILFCNSNNDRSLTFYN